MHNETNPFPCECQRLAKDFANVIINPEPKKHQEHNVPVGGAWCRVNATLISVTPSPLAPTADWSHAPHEPPIRRQSSESAWEVQHTLLIGLTSTDTCRIPVKDKRKWAHQILKDLEKRTDLQIHNTQSQNMSHFILYKATKITCIYHKSNSNNRWMPSKVD